MHAQGVKQSVCPSVVVVVIIVVVVVGRKIVISRLLGICECYKHNKLIDISEKRTSNRSKGLTSAKNRAFSIQHACGISATPTLLHNLLMQLRMLKLSVGKGCQIIKQLCCRVWRRQSTTLCTVAIERAGYVLCRALIINN